MSASTLSANEKSSPGTPPQTDVQTDVDRGRQDSEGEIDDSEQQRVEQQRVLERTDAFPAGWDDRPWDDRLWGNGAERGDRQNLLNAIDQSLAYLQTPAAVEDYRRYPIPEITRDRVQRSLERFRTLLLTSQSPADLQAAVLTEFEFYRSIGTDGAGMVTFTGYFEPTYSASRVPTPDYRYPLYQRPDDFDLWPLPHPTRLELEGHDGLQAAQGPLQNQELVWLRDRLEAFLIQVQGSARLQLTDGSEMSVGYAGRTDYPYRSIGRMLVDDGHIPEDELSLPRVLDYFRRHPDALDVYLPRNNRFVFFRETFGAPPQGSLGVPVTAERSIATDKSLMPPGALALIVTDFPVIDEGNTVQVSHEADQEAGLREAGLREEAIAEGNGANFRRTSRYVLDQDTGGAIQGAGRVDIFMGTGSQAGERAGLINSEGELYYLLLRD